MRFKYKDVGSCDVIIVEQREVSDVCAKADSTMDWLYCVNISEALMLLFKF